MICSSPARESSVQSILYTGDGKGNWRSTEIQAQLWFCFHNFLSTPVKLPPIHYFVSPLNTPQLKGSSSCKKGAKKSLSYASSVKKITQEKSFQSTYLVGKKIGSRQKLSGHFTFILKWYFSQKFRAISSMKLRFLKVKKPQTNRHSQRWERGQDLYACMHIWPTHSVCKECRVEENSIYLSPYSY